MELQEIKANLSIATVLAHYHLKLDRNNRLCCPWHDDKTPSLQIYLLVHKIQFGPPASDTKRLVLTESVIDAATLVQATEEKVLALYGTNGLSEEHLVALDRLDQLEELILFFDGDEAGQMAVAKWSEVLHHRYGGLRISQVNTPEGEDVNSLVQGHESTILVHLIKERIVLFFSIFQLDRFN